MDSPRYGCSCGHLHTIFYEKLTSAPPQQAQRLSPSQLSQPPGCVSFAQALLFSSSIPGLMSICLSAQKRCQPSLSIPHPLCTTMLRCWTQSGSVRFPQLKGSTSWVSHHSRRALRGAARADTFKRKGTASWVSLLWWQVHKVELGGLRVITSPQWRT
jgi:hypothetical protein